MDSKNNENVSLYKNEKKVVLQCNKIIDKFYSDKSKREQEKKKHELFHLLTLIDMNCITWGYAIKEVVPHEPGDAIIIDKSGNKHLIEIFYVFGDEENIEIKKLMKNIFGDDTESYIYNTFDNEKMKSLFLSKLADKNEKDYLKDEQYKTRNILVVTCEYNRCAITSNWVLAKMGTDISEALKEKNYDNLYVIDYMSSGKDEGPSGYNIGVDLALIEDRRIKQKELAKESVNLIKEFRKLNEIVSENIFNSVKANANGSYIIIDHKYEGRLEYSLDEVSKILKEEMDAFEPYGSPFYDIFQLAIEELDFEYEKRVKRNFIEYTGKLYYMKFRCEEIYERLKIIEEEARV